RRPRARDVDRLRDARPARDRPGRRARGARRGRRAGARPGRRLVGRVVARAGPCESVSRLWNDRREIGTRRTLARTLDSGYFDAHSPGGWGIGMAPPEPASATRPGAAPESRRSTAAQRRGARTPDRGEIAFDPRCVVEVRDCLGAAAEPEQRVAEVVVR